MGDKKSCSLLFTLAHSGKGSANSEVKNVSCKKRTNCMAGMWSPCVCGRDWLGRSKRHLGKGTHEQ